jgi:polyhydroxyalkanoate synthesis regulator phasin
VARLPTPGGEPGRGRSATARDPRRAAVEVEDLKTDDKKGEEKKGRLSELMETSLSSLVPTAKSFAELREEVQRLNQRVEALEEQLARRSKDL